jgi:hypothetical protein
MVVMNKKLPFVTKVPTEEMQKAFDELESKEGRTFKDVDELFNYLDN